MKVRLLQSGTTPDKLPPPLIPVQSHTTSFGISSGAFYEDFQLLSPASRACLIIWARTWVVGDAFQHLSLLEALFLRHKRYQVPVWALLNAYEVLYHRNKRNPGWLSLYEVIRKIENVLKNF